MCLGFRGFWSLGRRRHLFQGFRVPSIRSGVGGFAGIGAGFKVSGRFQGFRVGGFGITYMGSVLESS